MAASRPIALVSGTSIQRSSVFASWATETVSTRYGQALVKKAKGLILLNRHGPSYLPPHAINYRANIQALADLGVQSILSLNSVGSLQPDLPPGTLLNCGDYVSFSPLTFSDTELRAMGPVLSNNLLPEILPLLPEPIPTGRVYVQTRGPRFETRAEVRILRSWGDVVGMTLAHEADLAQEAGIGYTSLCLVDNFAHGIAGQELTPEAFRELVLRNQAKVDDLFTRLIAHFGTSS